MAAIWKLSRGQAALPLAVEIRGTPMKTRLKACERWHPGEPGDLHKAMRKNSLGMPYPIHLCRVCERTKKRVEYAGTQPPPLLNRPSRDPTGPYGVLPRLDWAPPQL